MAVQWGETTAQFIACSSDVQVLTGPVGSGKSSAAAFKLMRLAMNTLRGRDGVRRSRSIIIRNTYRELADSCIRTFFHWVPRGAGEWREADMEFRIRQPGVHDHQFMFRAFDSAADVGKLLSTEYSYAWLSEARELPEELMHMLPARLRFPSQQNTPGFCGKVLIESNPSDLSHWLYRVGIEERPQGWSVFQQPSGLSPEAENVQNLPAGYYQSLIASRPRAWVDCFVHGKWVFYSSDMPVFPEWIGSRHIARQVLDPVSGERVVIGLDFGLTPAAVFLQRSAAGQWRVLDELCTDNMGAARFALELRHLINARYKSSPVEIWGDPAGEQRAQTDEATPYQILAAKGIEATPAPTNDWTTRRESVAALLNASDMSGGPALLVSPACRILSRGMAGDYRYKRIQVSGTARYGQEPVKTSSSHACDALGYALLGAGEDTRVLGGADWSRRMDEGLRQFSDQQQALGGTYRRAGKVSAGAN